MDDELTYFLKNNPDVHQKIIDNAMKNGNVFEQQAGNPVVQENYKEAEAGLSPMRQGLQKAINDQPEALNNMMSGMAMGGVGAVGNLARPLTGIVERGLGEGLKFGARTAAEVAPKAFGKVIIQEDVPQLAKTIPFEKLTKLFQSK